MTIDQFIQLITDHKVDRDMELYFYYTDDPEEAGIRLEIESIKNVVDCVTPTRMEIFLNKRT